MKTVIKHFEFTEKEIAAGKYQPMNLLQPFWFLWDTDEGIEAFHSNLSELTDAQIKILACLLYEGEICNGGHDQFFTNSTGILWKDALEGMRMIGDDEDADNFQKVLDYFDGDVPYDHDERQEALEKIYDEHVDDDEFNDFQDNDIAFDDNRLDEKALEYIKNHPYEFVVNGDYECFDE